MKERIEGSLAVIQIGINLVGALAGMSYGDGASAVAKIQNVYKEFNVPVTISHDTTVAK